MKELLVKNIAVPFIILILIHLGNYLHPIPVSVQMIGSAVLLIYIGCILSASLKSASYTEIKSC